MLAHEYSVIGHDRARVGRYLGVIAGVLASFFSLLLAALIDVVNWLGLGTLVPHVVLLPISAVVIYPLAYLAFNKWAWRTAWLRKVLDIPDISGDWKVEGETLGGGLVDVPWRGKVTIFQNWDKLKVRLETGNSKSFSVSASIIRDPAGGYKLMYSYQNEPDIGQPMQRHVGYCEIAFDASVSTGDGEYFNNLGRNTYGRMRLERDT